MTVVNRLEKALQTAKDREVIYGENGHELTAKALSILIPEGIALKTEEDYCRFLLFSNIATKFARFCMNYNRGGHQDSIHDLAIYAFILEDYMEQLEEKK